MEKAGGLGIPSKTLTIARLPSRINKRFASRQSFKIAKMALLRWMSTVNVDQRTLRLSRPFRRAFCDLPDLILFGFWKLQIGIELPERA